MKPSTLVVLLLLISVRVEAAAVQPPAFEPARTYAVVAGVLSWKDPNLSSFAKTHRKDRELYEALGARGVPEAQRVLLLDEQATTANIWAAVDRLVARAPPGSTFIFYYAGHGVKSPDGSITFASVDIDTANLGTTGLHVDELTAHLAGFRGARVFLLADCCYSGGLAGPAAALGRRGVQALSFTSAESDNESTGNWTFTQTVIDALAGRALADRDHDGVITLAELHLEIHDAMKFREQQRSGWADFGVPETLAFAQDRASLPTRNDLGAFVQATRDGEPDVGRVVDISADGRQLLLAFYDYSDETTVWVSRASTAPVAFPHHAVGSAVQVLWEKKWYAAHVLRTDDDFHWISYDNEGHIWDEWVTGARIRARHPEGAPAPRLVEVEWHGDWYRAEVRFVDRGKLCISYVGYDASWDECVVPDRVRNP